MTTPEPTTCPACGGPLLPREAIAYWRCEECEDRRAQPGWVRHPTPRPFPDAREQLTTD